MNIYAVNQSNNESFSGRRAKKEKNKGSVRAYMAASAVSIPAMPLGIGILKKMIKENKLSQTELSAVHSGLDKTLKDTGLLNKGVELIKIKDIPPSSSKKRSLFECILSPTIYKENNRAHTIIEQEIKDGLNKTLRGKLYGKKYREAMAKLIAPLYTEMFQNGLNAVYLGNANKIMIPETKLALSGFHEAGHALNNNMSTIGKMLQKSRRLTVLAVLPPYNSTSLKVSI